MPSSRRRSRRTWPTRCASRSRGRADMCGIVGVVQGEETWVPADLDAILAALDDAHAAMPDVPDAEAFLRAAEHIEAAEIGLSGVRGVLTIAQRPDVLVGAASVL